MNVKYYPARLAGQFKNQESALMSVGFARNRARLIIDNASVNGSDVVVADLGDGKGVALTKDAKGKTLLWQALLGRATDDPDEAMEDAKQLAAKLDDGSTIMIFSWTVPPSERFH